MRITQLKGLALSRKLQKWQLSLQQSIVRGEHDHKNIFCLRYNPNDEEHESCMAEAPRLAANLIEDGYISEGLKVLNWVRDSDDSEGIKQAASWLSRDDHTFVFFNAEEEVLVPEPDFFQYFRPDAREKYQRMTITELKTFLVQ